MSSPAVGAPVNLLALDGGGIRGVSELVILHEIMKRLQFDMGLAELPKPCDFFDLIGGTSTGGLIALMLGRLRMSTTDALKQYSDVAGKIFSANNEKKKWQEGRYKATTLEDEMKKMVIATILGSDGETKMIDKDHTEQRGATFVCAMPQHSVKHPRRFRTYSVRSHTSSNCKIWEAARATTAAPIFFKRIAIGEPGQIKEQFLDAGFGCNNPTQEILDESRSLFGDNRPLNVLLSLGSGEKLDPTLESSTTLLPRRVAEVTNLIEVLARIATDCEKVADDISRRFQKAPDVFFRFNASHGLGEITLQQWEMMDKVQTLTHSYLRQPNVSELVDAVVKRIQMSTETSVEMFPTLATVCGVISQPSIASSSVAPAVYRRVPSASRTFTGRDAHLKMLQDHFIPEESNSTQMRREFVLYGLGGSGKTQICLGFVEKNRDRFSEIFWVDAPSPEILTQSLEDIAESPTAKADGVEKTTDSVIHWLSGHESNWLLIIDNADDNLDIVEKNLPRGNQGNVLITSRDPNARRLVASNCWKEIGELDENDAIDLLLRAAYLDESAIKLRSQAKDIVNEVKCLALAVDQAGAIIGSGFCSIEDYPKRYETRRKDLLAHPSFRGASNYNRAVFNTWEVSFIAIERVAQSPDIRVAEEAKTAILLLQSFAMFHFDNIMEEIFRRCAERSLDENFYQGWKAGGEPLACYRHLPNSIIQFDSHGKWDPFEFGKGISILLSTSLIKPDTSVSAYSVHPLVHFWLRERMSKETKQYHYCVSTAILCASIGLRVRSETLVFYRKLIPHIGASRKCVTELRLTMPDGEFQFRMYDRAYLGCNDLKRLELVIQEVKWKEENLGKEHRATLEAMGRKARVYQWLDRWKDSEEVLMQLFETQERLLGTEHRDTLNTIQGLCAIHSHHRRWEEAEVLQRRALERAERVLGRGHFYTLEIVSQLSATLVLHEKWQKAEELLLSVIGGNDPATLQMTESLARVYTSQGKLKHAAKLLMRVLEETKKSVGQEHEETFKVMITLAKIYISQERPKEAEGLARQVFEKNGESRGWENFTTVDSMRVIATAYESQGMWKEGEEMRVSVIEALKRTLEPDHNLVLYGMYALAKNYESQKMWKEGEELHLLTIEVMKRTLGSEHTRTLDRMLSQGLNYHTQEKWKEAEELLVSVVEVRKRILGLEHTHTLNSMNSLALNYHTQKKWKKGEELFLSVVEVRKRILGSEHTNTLKSMHALALNYHSQEKWEESEKIFEEVLKIGKRVLGAEHSWVLDTTMKYLEDIYRRRGLSEEADELKIDLMKLPDDDDDGDDGDDGDDENRKDKQKGKEREKEGEGEKEKEEEEEEERDKVTGAVEELGEIQP